MNTRGQGVLKRKCWDCSRQGFGRNGITSIQFLSQVSLAILNCLVEVLGGTKSPSPDTIRQLSLLELSAQVNVRIAHGGRLQRQVLIYLI
jgi:hypothetical protein